MLALGLSNSASCYRPCFNAPGTSKGETINAVTVNAGGNMMALVDAVLLDVASSFLLKIELQQIPTVGNQQQQISIRKRNSINLQGQNWELPHFWN